MLVNLRLISEGKAVFFFDTIYDELARLIGSIVDRQPERYSPVQHLGLQRQSSGCLAPFTFSEITAPKIKHTQNGFWVIGGAGIHIASPSTEFGLNLLCGLAKVKTLTIGEVKLGLKGSFVPHGNIQPGYEMVCLSPVIVAADDGQNDFLRYEDNPVRYSERLRQGLMKKYRDYYGYDPLDDRFLFFYDEEYLKNGLSACVVKRFGREFFGQSAPFTVAGSLELTGLAVQAGLGEKTEMGFGMIADRKLPKRASDGWR
ncbi:CRISPR-associated endoribonuclease Cas6 [Methylomusa anaerophila]|uniref:CRISPR associated protein Cas6 n=1 Tax=Methylomusa anaerophila TaxID=1930071 RepID=A0A348AR50_9FIRM|nr:CRISPR-associated endoribonuclease Cas6 [Methylomusa anaerophila]BBB93548.1 CRISPR associated protein Cas6 [Methylomusa anaerophila]